MKSDRSLIIDQISKLYDGKHGIKFVSTVIHSGAITAIVGPNGAGKTTLIKILAGLISPTEGEIKLFGKSMIRGIDRVKVGYMQNDLGFYYRMTVYELLDFFCKVKLSGNFYDEIDIYLKRYSLYEQRNCRISKLSLGMQKKLSIIMALIGRPELILLDEPTNGIDTYGILQFKEDIKQCARKGSVVIVTGHVLDFLEKVCSHCIFLKDGEIVKEICTTDGMTDLEKQYEQIYLL